MKIDELFRRDIHRKIEEVVKVDLSDESVLAGELDEYVATRHILDEFEKVLEQFCLAVSADRRDVARLLACQARASSQPGRREDDRRR